jgi:hypothetical protein
LLQQELKAATVQNEIDLEVARGGIRTSILRSFRIAFQPSVYIAGAGVAVGVTGAVGSGLVYGGTEIAKYFEVQQIQKAEAIKTATTDAVNQRSVNAAKTKAEETRLMIEAESKRISIMTKQFKDQTAAAAERKEALK